MPPQGVPQPSQRNRRQIQRISAVVPTAGAAAAAVTTTAPPRQHPQRKGRAAGGGLTTRGQWRRWGQHGTTPASPHDGHRSGPHRGRNRRLDAGRRRATGRRIGTPGAASVGQRGEPGGLKGLLLLVPLLLVVVGLWLVIPRVLAQ